MISEPPILTTVLTGAFVEKMGVAPELEISMLRPDWIYSHTDFITAVEAESLLIFVI